MRTTMRASLAALALGLAAAWAGAAGAADEKAANATGTWKWTVMPPGGNSIDLSAKLKQDGEKLTGDYTGPDGTATPIKDGKVKGDEVSFAVDRERDGNTFTVKYKGKLSGDAIKGKATVNFGGEDREFDWEAKRS